MSDGKPGMMVDLCSEWNQLHAAGIRFNVDRKGRVVARNKHTGLEAYGRTPAQALHSLKEK